MTQADRLEKLAGQYEEKARALRLALELLHEDSHAGAAKAGIAGKLQAAARLRGEPAPIFRGKKRSAIITILREHWQRGEAPTTRAVVERLKIERHLSVTGSSVQSVARLVGARRGGTGAISSWLAPAGQAEAAIARANGNGHPAPAADARAAKDERRRMMIDLLARLDRKRPQTTDQIRAALVGAGRPAAAVDGAIRGLGAFTRRGYLRKKRGGYVATAKTYAPTLLEAQQP